MPELPEVDTIRAGMEKYLVGHKIESVDVRLEKVVTGDKRQAIGAVIKKVRRFGKVLSIDLDNGYSIVAHVKLTGQFIYIGPDRPKSAEISKGLVGGLPGKHTHVIFTLDKGGKLFYNDIRQFGWIKILPTPDVEKMPFVRELGPEPPVADAMAGQALTLERFHQILAGRGTKIKVLLMDQKKIGGVGNIYANDALFLSGIDPRRPAKSLLNTEVEKLYSAIEEVLKQGLKYGGATEMNFVNVLGEPGGYQEHFLVYGREGEKCLNNCGSTVKKIRLGGRGTYYCEYCQR